MDGICGAPFLILLENIPYYEGWETVPVEIIETITGTACESPCYSSEVVCSSKKDDFIACRAKEESFYSHGLATVFDG